MVIVGFIIFLLTVAGVVGVSIGAMAFVNGHDDGANHGNYRNEHSGVSAHLYDFAFRRGETNNKYTLRERNRKKFNRD